MCSVFHGISLLAVVTFYLRDSGPSDKISWMLQRAEKESHVTVATSAFMALFADVSIISTVVDASASCFGLTF